MFRIVNYLPIHYVIWNSYGIWPANLSKNESHINNSGRKMKDTQRMQRNLSFVFLEVGKRKVNRTKMSAAIFKQCPSEYNKCVRALEEKILLKVCLWKFLIP